LTRRAFRVVQLHQEERREKGMPVSEELVAAEVEGESEGACHLKKG